MCARAGGTKKKRANSCTCCRWSPSPSTSAHPDPPHKPHSSRQHVVPSSDRIPSRPPGHTALSSWRGTQQKKKKKGEGKKHRNKAVPIRMDEGGKKKSNTWADFFGEIFRLVLLAERAGRAVPACLSPPSFPPHARRTRIEDQSARARGRRACMDGRAGKWGGAPEGEACLLCASLAGYCR